MKEVSLDLQDRRVRLAELLLSVDEEAMIAYAAEIATAMDGRCTFCGDDSAAGCIEDDHEWIRRGC